MGIHYLMLLLKKILEFLIREKAGIKKLRRESKEFKERIVKAKAKNEYLQEKIKELKAGVQEVDIKYAELILKKLNELEIEVKETDEQIQKLEADLRDTDLKIDKYEEYERKEKYRKYVFNLPVLTTLGNLLIAFAIFLLTYGYPFELDLVLIFTYGESEFRTKPFVVYFFMWAVVTKIADKSYESSQKLLEYYNKNL